MDRAEAVVYAAGFFDGEGCISIEAVRQSEAWCVKHRQNPSTYREHRLRLRTKQKYSDAPLHLLRDTFGGNVHYLADDQAEHVVNGREAVAMLEELLPYLMVKKSQAEIAVRYFDMNKGERSEALQEVRRLKKTFDILGA